MEFEVGQIWKSKEYGNGVIIKEITPQNNVIYIHVDENEKEIGDMFVNTIKKFKKLYEFSYLYMMYLENRDDSLLIRLRGHGRLIGRIEKDGSCFIQSCSYAHEATELWKKYGSKIDETPVSWRGHHYILVRDDINGDINLKKIRGTHIWNITRMYPYRNICDNNIKQNEFGVPLMN